MLGYSHSKRVYLVNKSGFASGFEFDLPYVPVFYGRLASLSEKLADFNKSDIFYEAGLKIGDDNFSMIFPIYISDPRKMKTMLTSDFSLVISCRFNLS